MKRLLALLVLFVAVASAARVEDTRVSPIDARERLADWERRMRLEAKARETERLLKEIKLLIEARDRHRANERRRSLR